MTYTPTNWVDGSTPLNRANMMRIENELALLDGYTAPVPPPTYSASPPGSPVDGQLWFLPLAAGSTWQFRYNASAPTNKWEFVGGAPLITVDNTSRVTVVGWTWFGEGAITTPRSGLYVSHVVVGRISPGTAPAGTVFAAGAGINTTSGPNWNAQTQLMSGVVAAGVASTGTIILTAGDVAVIFAYGSAAGLACDNRTLSLLPIRVS